MSIILEKLSTWPSLLPLDQQPDRPWHQFCLLLDVSVLFLGHGDFYLVFESGRVILVFVFIVTYAMLWSKGDASEFAISTGKTIFLTLSFHSKELKGYSSH